MGAPPPSTTLPQRRLRAVQHKQTAGQRHQHPLAVLSPGVLGHPQLALAQALTAQLFFQRKVLFADAAIGRGKQQPLLTRLDVECVQLASEATFRAEQKGQQVVVRTKGERAGDGHSRRRVTGDFFDGKWGRLLRIVCHRFLAANGKNCFRYGFSV